MTGELTTEGAIERARAASHLAERIPARAWRTERLDRPGSAYYLVVFGDEDSAVGVASVDARSGEVHATARLSGQGPHLSVTPSRALALAALDGAGPPRLVWRPCRASLSPLRPIWEVRGSDRAVYVDQEGRLWETLTPPGPGGASET